MGTYILNKYQAAKLQPDPSRYNVIIRITSPTDDFLPLQYEANYRDILELSFFDFTDDSSGLYVFNENLMDKVLAFFEAHKSCDNMVIHCDLGMSRSAGVAVGWFIFKGDNKSIHQLYHDNKHLPNELIVKMFAKKLNNNILKFIEKWRTESSGK
jgi:predicted protein tyrosine phosphatase